MRPVLGGTHQPDTHWFTLDTPTNNIDVFIISERKAHESSVVEVPVAAYLVMTVITQRVGCGHPAQHSHHLTILGRVSTRRRWLGIRAKQNSSTGYLVRPSDSTFTNVS